MRTKYELHRRITELSKRELPPVYTDQIQWGFDHCLWKYAHKSRGKIYCLECGYSWKPTNKRKIQVCPECNEKLKMIKEYRTRCNEIEYMAIVTVCGGFQVVRMVWIKKTMSMNHKAEYYSKEVMQHWIDHEGNHTTMSLPVNGLTMICDSWRLDKEMKIAESRGGYATESRHNISPYKTHPSAKILPLFKRNGFKGDFHGISPIKFFRQLLRDRSFEMLLKVKQYEFLRQQVWSELVYSHWPAIKICIRNNYIVKDGNMYKDYINLLQYFHKDLRNAHYVCPKDLKEAHDILMNKKREIQRKEQAIRDRENEIKRIEKAKKDMENFINQKSDFFDLFFTDGKIKIVPLKSIDEFKQEGDQLHHCVYTNAYYNLKDSLIMSARIDDMPIETVEISLKRMEIAQSRGLRNNTTEHHDKIIKLVKNNMDAIKQKVAKNNQNVAV